MYKKLTFEAACKITGDDATRLPDVSWMPELRGKAILADYQLVILHRVQCIKDKFWPDYSNRRQDKWYAWLEWVPSLSRFVFDITDCTGTGTILGSRFCFVDENTARKFFEDHAELYNDVMREQATVPAITD